MPSRTGARRRLGSIRLSLILLALVPSVTLAVSWGVTTTQMFSEGLRLRTQTGLSKSTGAMGTTRLSPCSGSVACRPPTWRPPAAPWTLWTGSARRPTGRSPKLDRRASEIEDAPDRIGDQLYSVMGASNSLEYYRDQVDSPTDITPEQVLDQYSSIIDGQIHAFQQLTQVDDGDLTSQAGPLVTSRRRRSWSPRRTRSSPSTGPRGSSTRPTRDRFAQVVNARRWLVDNQLVPSLEGEAKTEVERIVQGSEWRRWRTWRTRSSRPGRRAPGRPARPNCRRHRHAGTPR